MKEKPSGGGLVEGFKGLKKAELTGGLIFSALATVAAPALVVPGLIFSAWEYGQLKVVESWQNRKKFNKVGYQPQTI